VKERGSKSVPAVLRKRRKRGALGGRKCPCSNALLDDRGTAAHFPMPEREPAEEMPFPTGRPIETP